MTTLVSSPVHPGSPPDSPWWRRAVIYQIYPRSWADSNGDGVGDLPGITSRLPHLRDLGVDAVWLSPFYTSPQADAGYDVADYRDVDPLFGSLADADALVVVASRGGDDHHPAWFLNLRDDPNVEVVVEGRPSIAMIARIANAEQRARLWPLITAKYANYAGYQQKTDREIPLVLLEPSPSAGGSHERASS